MHALLLSGGKGTNLASSNTTAYYTKHPNWQVFGGTSNLVQSRMVKGGRIQVWCVVCLNGKANYHSVRIIFKMELVRIGTLIHQCIEACSQLEALTWAGWLTYFKLVTCISTFWNWGFQAEQLQGFFDSPFLSFWFNRYFIQIITGIGCHFI